VPSPTHGETSGPDLSVSDITTVLRAGASQALSPGVAVSQLDHALQTAALLERQFRGDAELAAAGLVHDIGHLLPGGSDETHAEHAAGAVRQVLGERVAGIVALHVAAKRYLVATEGAYSGGLSGDSVVSLGRQGGAMSESEVAAFAALPWADDAVTLRRADDSGKVEGLAVRDLADWAPVLCQLSEQARGAEV
jgi:predicted HD phosphohydrolase